MRVDDDVLRALTLYSWCEGETVRLPEGLRRETRMAANNALVRIGAVRRDGAYWFHPGGCAPLILAARIFPKRRRPRPVRPSKPRQYGILELVNRRLEMSRT